MNLLGNIQIVIGVGCIAMAVAYIAITHLNWEGWKKRRHRTPAIRNPQLRDTAIRMRAVAASQRGDGIKEHTRWRKQRRLEQRHEWCLQWEALDPPSPTKLRELDSHGGFSNPDAIQVMVERQHRRWVNQRIEETLRSAHETLEETISTIEQLREQQFRRDTDFIIRTGDGQIIGTYRA